MKAALAALLLAAAAPSAAPHVLRAQAWTASDPALAHALTHAPRECVGPLSQPAEAGRALFRSPGLLGGPAARLGLSCNACHSNGRVNAAFFLPELTNRAGAADVTSEWASKVRGDGVMNPRPIPDLAGVGLRPTHGRLADPSLEHFVHGVIEEEFQGQPPSPEGFDDLMAYLRALDANCAGEVSIGLTDAADDVRRAIAAAQRADAPTASALMLAAQDAVGRLVERLPETRFGGARMALETLARELGAMRYSADVHAALDTGVAGWSARFDAIVAAIAPRERQTYFDEATLRAALNRRS
ncbi:MAG: hypothetical protein JSS00_11815 [Proteobacteria bacterium]|nr:hypothetical protein [Pseudomonadota bacterium]